MNSSFLQKQNKMRDLFLLCKTSEEKYMKIIELGKTLTLSDSLKTSKNRVSGCQSVLYLGSWLKDGFVFFGAESEALISSGLAAILITIYSGEIPEIILKEPPSFIEELGINASLSLGRSNGLKSVYLRMKQDALCFLIEREKTAQATSIF